MKNYKFISQLDIDDEIKIRQLEESDVDEYYNLIDKNRVYLKGWMRWAEKTTKALTSEFAKKTQRNNKLGTRNLSGRESICDCAILYKGKIIGIIGLLSSLVNGEVEIGYWLDEYYNGKGIITKTAKKVIEYCLAVLKFDNVFISVNIKNKKSQAVAERIGGYYKKEIIEKDLNRGGDGHIYYYFDKRFI